MDETEVYEQIGLILIHIKDTSPHHFQWKISHDTDARIEYIGNYKFKYYHLTREHTPHGISISVEIDGTSNFIADYLAIKENRYDLLFREWEICNVNNDTIRNKKCFHRESN